MASKENALKDIKNDILASLPDGVAVLLANSKAIAVEGLIEVVDFPENRYVKFVNHMKVYKNVFERIISLENLFSSWDVFRADKKHKSDVLHFEWRLEENIFRLHRELKNKTYTHGPYKGFYIQDPKQRHIHKASVRDRVLHHAVFSVINPIFEETFIPTSFSCRVGYGTHKGVKVLEKTLRKLAKNGTGPCFALKCDIEKFFDSVDHIVLVEILKKRIKDDDALWLLKEIVGSYAASPKRERERETGTISAKGMPIGNLTSQLFANIYMNEFDQFMKHGLRIQRYFRYTDDFIVVADDRGYLENLLPPITKFLEKHLDLVLHPKKIIIRPLHQGVDFLGYIILPHYRELRTKTKRRILRKLEAKVDEYRDGPIPRETVEQSLQSYLGVLSHANAYTLSQQVKNQFWFWLNE